MPKGPRIGIISPMPLIVPDVDDAFAALWPEAEVVHVIDGSIYNDYIGGGRVFTDDIRDRVTSLCDQCAKAKPAAMMFTGSVFGEPIEALRPRYAIPLLTAFDGIVEAAFATGRKFGIITTSPFSLADLKRDLERYSRVHGLKYTVKSEVAEAARPVILIEKDRDKHDRMIAKAAEKMEDVDALLLGQFSLSLAYHRIARLPNRVVLTTSRTAIDKLKAAAGA